MSARPLTCLCRVVGVCAGEDPLEELLVEADYWAGKMNRTLDEIKKAKYVGKKCVSETKIALGGVQDMFEQVIVILTYAQCPHLHKVWSEVMEYGLCDEVFSGVYVMWIAQLTALACLFVLMLLAAVVYPSYRGRFYRTLCWCFYKPRSYWRKVCRYCRPSAGKKRSLQMGRNPITDAETGTDLDDGSGAVIKRADWVGKEDDVELVPLGNSCAEGGKLCTIGPDDIDKTNDDDKEESGVVTAALGGLWRWGGRLRTRSEWLDMTDDYSSTDDVSETSTIGSSTWSGVSDNDSDDANCVDKSPHSLGEDFGDGTGCFGFDNQSGGPDIEIGSGRYQSIEEVVSIFHSSSQEGPGHDEDESEDVCGRTEDGRAANRASSVDVSAPYSQNPSPDLSLSIQEDTDLSEEGDSVVVNILHSLSRQSSASQISEGDCLSSPRSVQIDSFTASRPAEVGPSLASPSAGASSNYSLDSTFIMEVSASTRVLNSGDVCDSVNDRLSMHAIEGTADTTRHDNFVNSDCDNSY